MIIQDPTVEGESTSAVQPSEGERHHRENAWLSQRDRQLIRATLWLWPVPVLGAAMAVFLVGFAVTFDGSGYIFLGDVLLNGNFATDWDYLREPGFPLLLRLTALSHLGIPGFLAVSGFMAGLAVALVGGAFFDFGRNWQRLVAGLVAVSSSIYISYAGWVMQQTGMALLLALFGWNIRLIQTGEGLKPLRLVSLGVLGAVSLYYSFAFAPIVVAAAVVCAAIVARRLRGVSARRIVATGIALVCVVAIPAAAYAPWHQARSGQQTLYITGSSLAPSMAGGLASGITGPDKGTYLRNRLATALALLHLDELAKRVTADQTIYPSEDMQWAYMRYGYTRASTPNCGVLDLQPDGQEKALRYLGDKYGYCTPIDGTRWLAVTAQRSYLLGGIASVLMIIGTLWAFWRRRDLVAVLAIPWAWLAAYALFIALDRYAIPIWPYKIMFGFLLVFGAGSWLLRKIRPRVSDDELDTAARRDPQRSADDSDEGRPKAFEQAVP